jgi:hypothetical protein
VLYRFHESYALRGSVEARSCNPEEARVDVRTAIDLAERSHDDEAAMKYASINPDDCWWGVKDGQPEQ